VLSTVYATIFHHHFALDAQDNNMDQYHGQTPPMNNLTAIIIPLLHHIRPPQQPIWLPTRKRDGSCHHMSPRSQTGFWKQAETAGAPKKAGGWQARTPQKRRGGTRMIITLSRLLMWLGFFFYANSAFPPHWPHLWLLPSSLQYLPPHGFLSPPRSARNSLDAFCSLLTHLTTPTTFTFPHSHCPPLWFDSLGKFDSFTRQQARGNDGLSSSHASDNS
jgi:hypothetical protein